jgi:hypothetical protein
MANTDFVKQLVRLNSRCKTKVEKEGRISNPGTFQAGDVADGPFKEAVILAAQGASLRYPFTTTSRERGRRQRRGQIDVHRSRWSERGRDDISSSPNEIEREIRLLSRDEPTKLLGGVVIEGLPESGLAGTIASSCLVALLKPSQVGQITSDYFPLLATVQDAGLQALTRNYANAKRNIAIFLGDFDPDQRASHLLARTVIDWTKRKEYGFIST